MDFDHPPQLDDNDKTALLTLARTTLSAFFNDDAHGPLRAFELALSQYSPSLCDPYPCFVSLMRMEIQLRGCIGTLETENSLYNNVHENTLKAAFSDPRFSPLRKDELDQLHIEITVLGPTLPLPLLDHLEIGKHGLVIESGHHRGVLLAHVATEWGWDKKEFIDQTCQKAGLDPRGWEKYKLSYFEEIVFREWRNASSHGG